MWPWLRGRCWDLALPVLPYNSGQVLQFLSLSFLSCARKVIEEKQSTLVKADVGLQ